MAQPPPTGGSDGIGATGSHVPCKSLIRLHAAFMPGAIWAAIGSSPGLLPGKPRVPGFDTIHAISTLHRRFARARLSGSHLTGSSPAFSATLTTTALNGRSLQ